jgi:hypothetical protein
VYVDVRDCLSDALLQRFGHVKIEENPERHRTDSIAPDFMVFVDGVEFHNMHEEAVDPASTPRTTHKPSGFVLAPRDKMPWKSKIKPTEIAELAGL